MNNRTTPGAPKTVALFGGAFDPFHHGHAAVITHLLALPGIDHVVVMPSGDRPDKKGVSPARDRLEMVKRGVSECFHDNPRVEVSDIQACGVVGYGTIDVVTHYEKGSSDRTLVVIGQELVHDLAQWKDAEGLRNRAHFLVLQRPGAKPAPPLPGWNITIADAFKDGGVAISSTELRRRLALGERLIEFMPASVIEYCLDKKLYT